MTILAADRWLYDVLSSDATLQGLINERVFMDVAPEASDYPFVSLQFIYGSPVTNMSVDIVMFDEVWLVQAVGKGNDYTILEPITNRISAVLHKAADESAGVVGCAQEEIIRYAEIDQGETYKHLGHYYRIYTQ